MAKIDNHPTVKKIREQSVLASQNAISAEELKRLCLELGADDAGLVSIGRPELDDQREDILKFAPWTKRYWLSCAE